MKKRSTDRIENAKKRGAEGKEEEISRERERERRWTSRFRALQDLEIGAGRATGGGGGEGDEGEERQGLKSARAEPRRKHDTAGPDLRGRGRRYP